VKFNRFDDTGILKLLVFSVLLSLMVPSSLFSDPPSIGGYYKNFFVVFEPTDYSNASDPFGETTQGMVTNRLRLDFDYNLSNDIGIHAAYNFVPRIQDPSLFQSNPLMISINPREYRVADLDDRIYPESPGESESVGIYQNLDRLYMSVALPFADIYLGRQAIAWGSSKVINPIDVIAPYAFTDLDTEERTGVDAIRMRFPIGFMGEIDLGYVAGDDLKFRNSAAFIRGKTYIEQTDVTLLAVAFREHLMVGIDMTRAIGGAGVWVEAGYVFVESFQQKRPFGLDYLRASVGIDYSFSDGTYGFLEVHYSEAGATDPENYLTNYIQHPAFSDGAVYLMGQTYVMPGIVYQFTPLFTLTGQAMYNIDDRSLFLAPVLEYNIAQDVYLGGGAFFGLGKNPAVGGLNEFNSPYPILRSEFGFYPTMFYTTFRFYF